MRHVAILKEEVMKMSNEVKPQTFHAVKFFQERSKLTVGKQGKVEIRELPASTRWPAVFKLKARPEVVARPSHRRTITAHYHRRTLRSDDAGIFQRV
jgi:hypothetical protein